jgi:hypothetical protein
VGHRTRYEWIVVDHEEQVRRTGYVALAR